MFWRPDERGGWMWRVCLWAERYCSTMKCFMVGNREDQTSSRDLDVPDNHSSTSKPGVELTNFTHCALCIFTSYTATEAP